MGLIGTLAKILLHPFHGLAADISAIPPRPIALKKELLFADDFEGAEGSSAWHKVVPTFAFEQGALKGTQTRDKTIPAEGGKRAITAHTPVHDLEIPTSNSIVEARIRFEGATMIDVEFDDRKYAGAHYGHICRAQVRLNSVTIDGQPAGYLKSSGIAHATKSKIELGVAGTDGFSDDIKVWDAESATP